MCLAGDSSTEQVCVKLRGCAARQCLEEGEGRKRENAPNTDCKAKGARSEGRREEQPEGVTMYNLCFAEFVKLLVRIRDDGKVFERWGKDVPQGFQKLEHFSRRARALPGFGNSSCAVT